MLGPHFYDSFGDRSNDLTRPVFPASGGGGSEVCRKKAGPAGCTPCRVYTLPSVPNGEQSE